MTKEERKEYDHQRYLKNKEKRTEQMKQYYLDNKEHIAEYKKQYYLDKKEHIAEYKKQWEKEHKEERADYMKQYHEEYYSTPIGRGNSLAANYRQNDKLANRGECTVTHQWIVDNVFSGQRCFYCGETDWRKLGCDRIDNNLPHTPDNVVCCCEECNLKRGTKPFEEFCKEMGVKPIVIKPKHFSCFFD